MLIELQGRRGLYLSPDEGGGAGAGTAVADPLAGGEGAGAAGDEGAGAEGAEGSEGEPAGGEGAEGAVAAQGTGRTFTDSDMAKMRRGMEAEFDKKLQKATDELRHSLTGEVQGVRRDVETLRPPPKHALETWFDSLPVGVGPTDDTDPSARGDQAYEKRRDIQALLPLIKEMLPHMYPELERLHTGTFASHDKHEKTDFIIEQLIGLIEPEKRPLALKHLDRIEKTRREMFQDHFKSTGRLPTRKDAFDRVQEQLKAETDQQGAAERKIREDAARDALRDDEARRRAAGSPAPAGAAPRGRAKGPVDIMQRIEEANARGEGLLIP